jgi:hypothetical protein
MFEPNLTPKEMIQIGIFGGVYFHPTERNIDIDANEFPSDWFEGLSKNQYCSSKYNRKVNYFNIKCGKSQEEWEQMGWMRKEDPRGWFQWYCRYYMGRRCKDDDRQIRRWLNFAGPTGRWRSYIYGQIHKNGGDLTDESYSRGARQSLLHWGYKVNENDYEIWKSDRMSPNTAEKKQVHVFNKF